ncbi:hypothetical protein MNAN1_003062 [Malassezia nana]|uniref:Reduced meiotic recombination protein 1 n=1 Tax=Malassezia nana TaxID=180528 RepID=A0AAF0ELM3_9BASI|nr:hypothetical protein MNAN1_003062 [Malassezia nana]
MAEAPDPADLDVYEMPDTDIHVGQSGPETDHENVAESAAEETALEDHDEDVADGEVHAEDVEEADDNDVDEATLNKEAGAGEKASAGELDDEDDAEEDAAPDATEEDAKEAGPDATELDEGEADPGATEEDAEEEADPDVAEDGVENEEAAPDDAEEAAEDNAPEDDASSSLSEDLPTIRLTFQGQDFAVFPSVMQDSGPFVYLDGEEGSDELVRVSAPELRLPPTTFWEPLDEFFAALRVKDALGEFLEDDTELCLSFPDLELDLMEDNVYARDITLHDISQLALGFGHQASLHILVSEEVRFISRYNELAMRINGAADSVDTNQNVAPVEEDQSAAPAAGDDGPNGVDEAVYDMDDDAGDVRRVSYDDADHAAYEDEADASVPRAKRAADEADMDEATKRTKTASDAT